MILKYWYIVVPIHVTISLCVFSLAYLMSVNIFSGLDIGSLASKIPLMEQVNYSGMGHVALGLIFMKLMTPFRVAITMTSSAVLIRRLQGLGRVT